MKKSKLLNVSVDDVSPHPLSSTEVLNQCFRVLDKFPDAKFTRFVPTAYWRTIGPTATAGPLDIAKFPTFCDKLRALPKSNFELCYHGHFHGIPSKSNNDELQNIDADVARHVIGSMVDMVFRAGLIDEFKGVLRPPAWRMASAVFDAAEQHGITTFALSPDEYAIKTYGDGHKGRNVVFYDCCPPMKPLELSDMTEIVYHACTWDVNSLTDERVDELMSFLSAHAGEYEFSFIEALAKRYK